MLYFFPRDVLDEILNLVGSVSGGGGGDPAYCFKYRTFVFSLRSRTAANDVGYGITTLILEASEFLRNLSKVLLQMEIISVFHNLCFWLLRVHIFAFFSCLTYILNPM